MKRIRNVLAFQRYEKFIVVDAPQVDGKVSIEMELRTVGPAVARVSVFPNGAKKAVSYLLGVFEDGDTINVSVDAPQVVLSFDEGTEVWYRDLTVPIGKENPDPSKTFTRMEKPGLYMDELGIALHRQAVLGRIAERRQNFQRDQYQSQLEGELTRLRGLIEAMAPTEPEQQEEQPGD